MSSNSATPATLTYTSLKDRPRLRFALQAAWVLIVLYAAYILYFGVSLHFNRIYSERNLLLQIAQIGLNLFTFSTVNILSDIYILLGYFILAIIIFMRRSDDWFAILLSIIFISFGMRVTNLSDELTTYRASQYLISPIIIMGEVGIVTLGWLYPDGKFFPHWLKYLLPVMVVNFILFYVPGSPFAADKLNPLIGMGAALFWYLSSGAALIYRYRATSNANQKQQIRGFFSGLMGPLVWFILFSGLAILAPEIQNPEHPAYLTLQLAMRVFSIILFLIFPIAVTIVIARYGLFDLDLIVNRAIVYGVLTVALASIFGLLLLLDSAVVNLLTGGRHTTIALTISAIVAGALFQPARKALQRFVDRSFYHINIDYLKTPAGKPQSTGNTDTLTQAPALFSGYRNLALIGKGGMAEVYRAEQTTTQRLVAIKVLLSNLSADEQFRKRFQREAHTLADLEHPNIVRLYDYGEENGLYYMVMEFLNGMNLSSLLKMKGRFEPDEILPILQDVSRALDYAHQSGLVHRDVKPSNVMLDAFRANHRAVLTDFGIAKLSRALTNITSSEILGTFDYISPEQIESAKIDSRADIYSLGVMTYQLLTGTLPFRRSNTGATLLAHMTAPTPDIRDTLPEFPRRAALAIQKAMSKKAEGRYATAGEFIQALEI